MTLSFLLLGFCIFGLSGCALAAPAKGKRLTDEEMYQQLATFVQTHQNMPHDKTLVDNILSSAKWAELHAQFGPQSPGKKMTIAERKKSVHK
jgi:hypothetical protein